jgi:hypothetical protein
VLALQAIGILLHGEVCNYSSTNVWLTVSEAGMQTPSLLAPGECTNFLTQDAEAIWGNDCRTEPCRPQAWKVSAGRFRVYDDGPPTQTVLRIDGWGAGSRWRVSEDWTKPNLSSINYSLTR